MEVSMNNRVIDNRELTETQLFPNLLTGTDIGTWQADYQLREVEFERIKNGKPITYNWANSIALTSFGFALNLLSKGYADILTISKGEWVALAFGVVITIVLYGITKKVMFMIAGTTLVSVVVVMFVIFFVINNYYEKHG